MDHRPRNYHETISVDATRVASFDAVATQMNLWWTTITDGRLDHVGDKVTARFPPNHGHWTFEATALDRGARIEMVCIDAHHKVEGQPKEIDKEWLGTKIIWAFDTVGDKTEITMTHDGLTPELICWGICLDGWNHFFKSSLKAYLDGKPPSPYSA